jgi:AAA15 family ATPase/GTPase
MSEHFIKEIEIKNYKLFKDFKASGFGRVNLIGGKNNVGKTAFMEACYLNVYPSNVKQAYTVLIHIPFMRNNLEFIGKNITDDILKNLFEQVKLYNSKTNINDFKYKLYEKDGKKEYRFSIKGENFHINVNEFSYSIEKKKDNIGIIDNYGLSNSELKEVYIAVQRKDKEEVLYKYINEFDKNIEKFKIMGGESPECKIKNKDEYRPINEFGDGLKHYISIICSLYACADGYLFIDEIDNGIHYTQLDKLWEIILKISKEQNVQVFATTHSKEMIESFNRVQKKLNDKETYYFEMFKNIKKDNIEMRALDSEQLEYELTHQGRYRGE